MPRITKIQVRKGTTTEWSSQNPVLDSGELGYDLTSGILKIGNGVSTWTALSGIGSTNLGGSSISLGTRGIINTTGTLSSFSVSGGYSVGYLDLFQDGVKLVADLDFSATDGSNVTLSNSVPSGTILEYLTLSSGVSGGGGSSSDSRWDLFLPPAPTNLIVTAEDSQVSLSWTAPTVLVQTPITDYIVQYSSNSGSSWATFTHSVSVVTSATVTGLANNVSYIFRVAAVNGVGQGAWSASSASVVPATTPTPTPTVTPTNTVTVTPTNTPTGTPGVTSTPTPTSTTIIAAPTPVISITSQPSDPPGGPSTVVANVTGGGTLTYLWQWSTDGSSWTSYSGGAVSGYGVYTASIDYCSLYNNNALPFSISGPDPTYFRVIISSSGASSVTSNAVQVIAGKSC